MFSVKVRAGVSNVPTDPPSDGDFDLDITGKVHVEAHDEESAKARALDVLENNDGWILTMGNGDGVEFEVLEVVPVTRGRRRGDRAVAKRERAK